MGSPALNVQLKLTEYRKCKVHPHATDLSYYCISRKWITKQISTYSVQRLMEFDLAIYGTDCEVRLNKKAVIMCESLSIWKFARRYKQIKISNNDSSALILEDVSVSKL